MLPAGNTGSLSPAASPTAARRRGSISLLTVQENGSRFSTRGRNNLWPSGASCVWTQGRRVQVIFCKNTGWCLSEFYDPESSHCLHGSFSQGRWNLVLTRRIILIPECSFYDLAFWCGGWWPGSTSAWVAPPSATSWRGSYQLSTEVQLPIAHHTHSPYLHLEAEHLMRRSSKVPSLADIQETLSQGTRRSSATSSSTTRNNSLDISRANDLVGLLKANYPPDFKENCYVWKLDVLLVLTWITYQIWSFLPVNCLIAVTPFQPLENAKKNFGWIFRNLPWILFTLLESASAVSDFSYVRHHSSAFRWAASWYGQSRVNVMKIWRRQWTFCP